MNILIIGGGLSGVLASAALRQKGISHDLVESQNPFTGSRASSGILNPVMGRKRRLVADYDVLMPACQRTYSFLENLLGIKIFRPVQIIEAISGQKAWDFFTRRAQDYPNLLHAGALPDTVAEIFSLPPETRIGATQQAYVLQTALLQTHYLRLLQQEGRLITRLFMAADAPAGDADFCYNGKQYTHIIYCNGREAQAMSAFSGLPLSVNKGQALLLEIAAPLPRNRIFKFGKHLTLCPWGERYWWAGASFEWTYETEAPTALFFTDLEKRLREFLKIPFRVVEQLSGFRVSSRDRRAVSGWLPCQSRIGILNAMGTKGVLQAPQAAAELVESLFSSVADKGLFHLLRLENVKGSTEFPDGHASARFAL